MATVEMCAVVQWVGARHVGCLRRVRGWPQRIAGGATGWDAARSVKWVHGPNVLLGWGRRLCRTSRLDGFGVILKSCQNTRLFPLFWRVKERGLYETESRSDWFQSYVGSHSPITGGANAEKKTLICCLFPGKTESPHSKAPQHPPRFLVLVGKGEGVILDG